MRIESHFRTLVPVLVAAAALLSHPAAADTGSVEAILEEFVADFRLDPAAAEAVTFGVSVRGEGGGEWHVVVAGETNEAGESTVELRPGAAPEPTFVYVADAPILARVHRGEINALTAMGKARSSDVTPMDIDVMEGFVPDGGFLGQVLPLTFHFWTRGTPEVVPYGSKSLTREVHGGNVTVFYYQPGFRSAWFQIENGQHVNSDPGDQVNPFPSMLVMIRGRAEGRIGGEQITLHAEEMMLIRAGVSHEFWNPYDEPAEGILLMFGDGA